MRPRTLYNSKQGVFMDILKLMYEYGVVMRNKAFISISIDCVSKWLSSLVDCEVGFFMSQYRCSG